MTARKSPLATIATAKLVSISNPLIAFPPPHPATKKLSVSTPYHSLYWATPLTLRGPGGSIERLSRGLSTARVDLNPHQVAAALFAIRSPLSKGVILADEVGLGKTVKVAVRVIPRCRILRRQVPPAPPS